MLPPGLRRCSASWQRGYMKPRLAALCPRLGSRKKVVLLCKIHFFNVTFSFCSGPQPSWCHSNTRWVFPQLNFSGKRPIDKLKVMPSGGLQIQSVRLIMGRGYHVLLVLSSTIRDFSFSYVTYLCHSWSDLLFYSHCLLLDCMVYPCSLLFTCNQT